jgi:hypothetical protein
MTAQILERVEAGEFDANALQAMGAAFDAACTALHDTGQPQVVREVIADRIIEEARHGERDPQRLCDYALAGIPRLEG